MKMKTITLLALLFLAAPFALLADSITVQYGTLGSTTPEGDPQTPVPFYYTIPQFNPDLGTLTSLSFSFVGSVEGAMGYNDVDSPIGTSFFINANASITETLDSPIGPAVNLGISASGTAGEFFPYQIGPLTEVGDIDTENSEPGASITLTDSGTLSGAALDPFIGSSGDAVIVALTPTMNYYISDWTLDGVPQSGIGPSVVTKEYEGDGTLTITETYDPAAIPEPKTIGWMVTLIALAAWHRRRLLRVARHAVGGPVFLPPQGWPIARLRTTSFRVSSAVLQKSRKAIPLIPESVRIDLLLVRTGRVELPFPCGSQILSLVRLPIPPRSRRVTKPG